MKRFRSTIEICVRSFERGIFHALIRAEQRREEFIKKMK